ncbi:PKD domain-containing protein [Spirosoma montaniterrae]|uniref:PKD domain-containing protein n=1 Tax=Spirosoma montaniterrae TaxID=1178516 RepID=A0A1P9X3Q6_9BACT|nr:PKD domain-containing protein [Spirosoma montaniterrae]AQG82276.1 PKD domain-containing protein [Spirosoma montaniterrae]
MRQCVLYFLLLTSLTACEPFDLTRKNFPVCAKPSADIGITIDRLDVTFFVENPQGDIGAIGWDPGDGRGINRVGSRVTYNYAQPGTYTVTLTLVNSCDDKFTLSRIITVRN